MAPHRTFHRAWTALLAAVSAALTVHPFFETDVYWHLALGRAVLEHRSRVVPEPMALGWTAPVCTASEWLWEVVASLLHHRPGAFGPLTALTAAFAAGSAALLVALVRKPFREGDESPSRGAVALVSALAMSLVLTRIRLRPESAVMVLLPAVALVSARHGRALAASEPRAWRWGVGLVALELLWAQVHPTFVLAPAVWAALMIPDAWTALRDRASPSSRATLVNVGAMIVALTLGLFTSAHGAHVIDQWRAHAGGDAVRHIADMRAPPSAFFDPRETTYGAFYLALLGLGVAGMLAARRCFVRELLLALPGVALVMTAVRGVGPAAVLAAPLAARGATELGALFTNTPWKRRLSAWPGVLLAVGVLALSASRTEAEEGPLGLFGPRPGSMPHAAARFLATTAPAGTPVITSFLSGAPLGYWLRGRVRTLLDSRTPMYFSDAEFGRARDLWRNPTPLALATQRYGFAAAVTDRDGPECALIERAQGWRPVVVEASFTTFVRQGTAFDRVPTLTRVAPCGAVHLAPDACGQDRGAALAAEIARLRALGAVQARPFYNYLDALRVVQCNVEGVPVQTLLARVPSERDAWVFRAQRDRVLARVLVASGDVAGAADAVERHVRAGDLEALAAVFDGLARSDPRRLRAMLDALARALDDNTSGDVRAELARLCADAGEAECARFHGLRAAVHGSPRAGPALCWLASRHPLAHVRRDALGWLQTLRSTASAQGHDDPRLACPAR